MFFTPFTIIVERDYTVGGAPPTVIEEFQHILLTWLIISFIKARCEKSDTHSVDKPVFNNNEEVCTDNLIIVCIAATVFEYTKKCITIVIITSLLFHKVQLNT